MPIIAKRPFEDYLREYLAKSGYSRHEVSRRAGFDYFSVKEWTLGTSVPDRSQLLVIAEVLRIPVDDTNRLLDQLGYERLGEKEKKNQQDAIDSIKPLMPTEQQRFSPNQTTGQANVGDIVNQYVSALEFKSIISDLDNRIRGMDESLKASSVSKTDNDAYQMLGDFQHIKESLRDLQDASQSIHAPVILPKAEDMKVTLVSSTSLAHLEEYRSEENKWFSICGVFSGAMIGILSNWATGGDMRSVAWTLLIIFGIMSIITGWTGMVYKMRGDKAKNKVLGGS